MDLSLFDAQSMPNIYMRKDDKWGFYGHSTIVHRYEEKSVKGGKVVVGHSTGLMWVQSGSRDYMRWASAMDWIEKLYYRKYAGYKDWRLPTLEESITLLEPERMSNGLYMTQSLITNNGEFGVETYMAQGERGVFTSALATHAGMLKTATSGQFVHSIDSCPLNRHSHIKRNWVVILKSYNFCTFRFIISFHPVPA